MKGKRILSGVVVLVSALLPLRSDEWRDTARSRSPRCTSWRGDGCCGTVADGLAVLCALWGFYAGPDPAWALDMTIPRQVWLAVVLSVGWFAGGRTAPGRIIVL